MQSTRAAPLSSWLERGALLPNKSAARNPSAHRSLIAFTAWSSFAHAAVMVVQSFQMPSERAHLLIGVALLAVIGAVLIALTPAKQSMQPASAVGD